jgi:hypothetical protein
MTQPGAATGPAIGACREDKQLFYVAETGGVCPFCARPPDLTLPLDGSGLAGALPTEIPSAAQAEPEPATEIGVTCPHCERSLTLRISDTEIAVVQPPAPPTAPPIANEVAPAADVQHLATPDEAIAAAEREP